MNLFCFFVKWINCIELPKNMAPNTNVGIFILSKERKSLTAGVCFQKVLV